MSDPRWLSRAIVDAIHSELLSEHGGAPGVRDGGDGLIESSLAYSRNRFAYAPQSDLVDLAAAYLFAFVKNHGYVDGNKRVGFACAAVFLWLNGLRLAASEVEAYDMVIGTAAGRYSEEEIAHWIRKNTVPVTEND